MPIYEYQCTACDHQLDALQKVSDPVLTDCPACGKSALIKQVSAPRFRLKGKGWYETDFKTGDKKNLAGDAGKPEAKPKSDKKPEKTDKPGKKTETKTASGDKS